MTNTNYFWGIESYINGSYTLLQGDPTRDGARALQRDLKASKSLAVPSRIRKYVQVSQSRG